MKLSLGIIYDQLKTKYPDIILNSCSPYDISLEMPAIYQKDISPSKDIVYLLSCKEYKQNKELLQDQSVIIYDVTQLNDVNNSIFIPYKIDKSLFFHTICQVFYDFEHWEHKIYEAISLHKDLTTLSTLLGQKLMNPACVLDLSFHFQSVVGDLPNEQELNNEWKDLIRYKESPIETFDIPKDKVYFFSHHKREFYQPPGSPYNNDEIFLNIYVRGKLFALLVNATLKQPFSIGEYSIMLIIRDYLEQYFTSDFVKHQSQDVTQYYFHQLLEASTLDENVFSYHLSQIGWNIESSYTVACIQFENNKENKQGKLDYTKFRIQKILPDDVTLLYYDKIILLSRNLNLKQLEMIANQFQLQIGVSFQQYHLLTLHNAYQQAILAIHYGQRKNPNRLLYTYADCYADDLKDNLIKNVNIDFFIPPVLKKVKEANDKESYDLIYLLKIYILCGCNSKKASELLYMHRNTLIYRIKKIESIIQQPISSFTINEFQIILLAIWLLEQDQR